MVAIPEADKYPVPDMAIFCGSILPPVALAMRDGWLVFSLYCEGPYKTVSVEAGFPATKERDMISRLIARSLPLSLRTRLRELRHSLTDKGTAERSTVFTDIHDKNEWRSAGTISGPGSEFAETSDVRALLPVLVGRLGIESLLDAPCGDFHWMSQVDLDSCRYVGAEVVPQLVMDNSEKFASERRSFILADLTRDDLPKVDLVLCRDCLIHLSFADAKAVLANIRRSGSRYLLTTTDPSVTENRPIRTGQYHAINLQLPPFSLGKPLELHRDRRDPVNGEKLIDPHKHLALYRLID